MTDNDVEFDRLLKLLDMGLESLRKGDGEGTIMALSEATKVVDAFPKKLAVISLPDQSTGKK